MNTVCSTPSYISLAHNVMVRAQFLYWRKAESTRPVCAWHNPNTQPLTHSRTRTRKQTHTHTQSSWWASPQNHAAWWMIWLTCRFAGIYPERRQREAASKSAACADGGLTDRRQSRQSGGHAENDSERKTGEGGTAEASGLLESPR